MPDPVQYQGVTEPGGELCYLPFYLWFFVLGFLFFLKKTLIQQPVLRQKEKTHAGLKGKTGEKDAVQPRIKPGSDKTYTPLSSCPEK